MIIVFFSGETSDFGAVMFHVKPPSSLGQRECCLKKAKQASKTQREKAAAEVGDGVPLWQGDNWLQNRGNSAESWDEMGLSNDKT